MSDSHDHHHISQPAAQSGGGWNRRRFAQGALAMGAAAMGLATATRSRAAEASSLRLGAPVGARDPESWIAELQRRGFRAAYCPVGADASDDVVNAYAEAARKADIVIAEVGAWSNPMSPNEEQRLAAQKRCREQLALAERIGANCCVNISGARGEEWAGHHPDNLTDETFDMIVEITRAIIDDVQPTRTFFTLETMQWSFPDSVDSYVRLIQAIDRKAFAVHFDPTNLVVSPRVYYHTGDMIRDCFKRLGDKMRSCHAKDVILHQRPHVHMDEIRPGLGNLDYVAFLQEMRRFPDLPVMIEHLASAEEYDQAADHIRSVDATIPR